MKENVVWLLNGQ